MSEHEDDPAMAEADWAVIHSASTGEGLIPLTSEVLDDLVGAAKATVAHFENQFSDMTREQAEFVYKIRCEDGYSWRAVAQTCALEWGGDWGSNQLAGMEICDRAAQILGGPHYMEEPWN